MYTRVPETEKSEKWWEVSPERSPVGSATDSVLEGTMSRNCVTERKRQILVYTRDSETKILLTFGDH